MVWLCPRVDISHSLWNGGIDTFQDIAYECYFLRKNIFGKYSEFKVLQLNAVSFSCSQLSEDLCVNVSSTDVRE